MTLEEGVKSLLTAVKQNQEAIVKLNDKIRVLECELNMVSQLVHEHNMTKIACSCPPCDAWGKAQDEEDSAWRWENVGPALTDEERAEIDADVQAGHMY